MTASLELTCGICNIPGSLIIWIWWNVLSIYGSVQRFAKFGVLKPGEDGAPRVKVYRDKATQMPKGDGLVTFLYEPSVSPTQNPSLLLISKNVVIKAVTVLGPGFLKYSSFWLDLTSVQNFDHPVKPWTLTCLSSFTYLVSRDLSTFSSTYHVTPGELERSLCKFHLVCR